MTLNTPDSVKLIEPIIEYEEQICAYRKEFLDCNSSMNGTSALKKFESPKDWIDYVLRCKDPCTTVPPGFIPSTQYILVREKDQKIVGMIQIRHYFNEFLKQYGGHIGYSVAPSERRKGYATLMLKMVLPKCKKLGIEKVLISCNTDNEGSKRTILNNNGVYESTVHEPNRNINLERYWIDLSRSR